MIEVTERPIWIGAAVGQFPAYHPIVFQRESGFEPGHMCQLDDTSEGYKKPRSFAKGSSFPLTSLIWSYAFAMA
jgi:hypothetical protein